ncbi:unnamed protein product [Bursaphelenchus okinawaensis]|uniref:Uncharacterized protein n=1 Tax=Bursaphelenchus okinawaensis TaxID=465554 RepID=A0A811JR51_9BILA|nr:unnamed protein product [Bursaphelenchus okinawaensis]CAG9078615.1 unnamed protein product [Bursaphelenchus okinawaensis]
MFGLLVPRIRVSRFVFAAEHLLLCDRCKSAEGVSRSASRAFGLFAECHRDTSRVSDGFGRAQWDAFYDGMSSYDHETQLENHDIQIKTNSELIRILQLYNGTNDVQAYRQSIKRIQPGVNWSFKAMNLFKNAHRNTRLHNGQPPVMLFAKSLPQVTLSRKAVDFMLTNMNIDRFVDRIEWNAFGVDENFIGSLNSNDAVGLPGGFYAALPAGTGGKQLHDATVDLDGQWEV